MGGLRRRRRGVFFAVYLLSLRVAVRPPCWKKSENVRDANCYFSAIYMRGGGYCAFVIPPKTYFPPMFLLHV